MMEQELHNLTAARERLETALTARDEQVTEAHQAQAKANEELATLRTTLEERKRELKSLKRDCKSARLDVNECNATIKALTRERDTRGEEVTRLTAEIVAKNKRIETLDEETKRKDEQRKRERCEAMECKKHSEQCRREEHKQHEELCKARRTHAKAKAQWKEELGRLKQSIREAAAKVDKEHNARLENKQHLQALGSILAERDAELVKFCQNERTCIAEFTAKYNELKQKLESMQLEAQLALECDLARATRLGDELIKRNARIREMEEVVDRRYWW